MEERMNVSQEKITVKQLLGINQAGIIWGRLAAFFFAYLLSGLFISILEVLLRSSSPPYGSWLGYFGFFLLGSVLFTACIAAAFYFILDIYLAIVVSAIGYSLLNTGIRSLLGFTLQPVLSIIFGCFWTFLVLLGLHIYVRKIKPTWLALMTAYFSAAVIQKIIVIIIYLIKEPGIIFSVKDELISLVFTALEAAAFGGLFWVGLQMHWSRWEAVAVPAAAAVTAVPGSWKSHELSELKKAGDSRMIQKLLRPAAIGSIVFGVIAVVLGIQGAKDLPINVVLALIGIFLFIEGIWCAAAPKPVGLVVDGIALIILGIWNILVTFSNISAGAQSMSGFIVLGIWQIVWGIQSINRYKHYAHLSGVTISQESVQNLDNMAANIKEASVSGDESMIEFQIKTLFKKTSLKGKLIEGMILFVGPKNEFFMDEIPKIKIKPLKAGSTANPMRASLYIAGITLLGEITRESMDRYQRFQETH
jgi:hypothetical protein